MIAVLGLWVFAEGAASQPSGRLNFEDHQAYFKPGTYFTMDADTGDLGRLTYDDVRFRDEAGERGVIWLGTRNLTLSADWREGREDRLVKLVRYLPDIDAIWSDETQSYAYERPVDYKSTEIWSSTNGSLEVAPEDKLDGNLYDILLEDGLDVSRHGMREPVRVRCAWANWTDEWDVICHYRFIEDGTRYRILFRRQIEVIG